MKIQVICAAVALASVQAFGCPDISGVYRATDKMVFKIEQSGCVQLTKAFAMIPSDGKSFQWNAIQNFKLDGTPLCTVHGACESAVAQAEFIAFQRNTNGRVLTDDHGICSQNGYDAARKASGDLEANFHVFSCRDGFKGDSKKVFLRY